MEQYWSFYHAGVTIFLFAGLTLLIKLFFLNASVVKKNPISNLNIGITALKMILNNWKKN